MAKITKIYLAKFKQDFELIEIKYKFKKRPYMFVIYTDEDLRADYDKCSEDHEHEDYIEL